MAEGVLIIGPSGSGKSTATRNMDPKDTFYINVIGKRVPYRGEWKSIQLNPPRDMTIEKILQGLPTKLEEGVNMVQTDNSRVIEALILHIDEHMPHIKSIIVDDWQYVTANHFMRKASVKSYDKFTQMLSS